MIRAFGECALQAKFKYVDRLPTKLGSSAHWGTSLHQALEHYVDHQDVQKAIEEFVEYYSSVTPDYWNRRTSFTGHVDTGKKILEDFADSNKWDDRIPIAAEHRFMVDIGDHQLSGIVDLLDVSSDLSELRIVDYKSGARPTKENLYLNVQFCADASTQILTRRGWKTYRDLLVGEDVLTLNQATGQAEWQPALGVHTFWADNQELVSLEGKAHSSLTTKNHRWPVDHVVSGQSGWRIEPRVVTSENLTGSDRIKCSAPVTNLPSTAHYSDDFVELVAWVWTEGSFRTDGSVCFSQSPAVNSDKVARIESLLARLYGTSLDSLHEVRGQGIPAWRVSRDSDVNRYYLNSAARSQLAKVFTSTSDKVVDPLFISLLPLSQLRLYIEVSMMADGHSRSSGRSMSQSSYDRASSFQMACTLAGIRTSLRVREIGGSGPYASNRMWDLSLKERSSNFVPSADRRSLEHYTGKVWCPRTENSTWLARRNGHVYFTGNTAYLYASEQKEFWTGYPGQEDKYPGLPNGEELYEALLESKRKGIWYDLKKNEEIDVGPRAFRDYARLYRAMEMIALAIENEVFIPSISASTCSFCDFQDICPVYFENRPEAVENVPT